MLRFFLFPNLPPPLLSSHQVIPLYLARSGFSTDASRPTTLTGSDGTAVATVFVEGDLVGADGGAIAPFTIASRAAAKAKPGVPYGIFVEPFRQKRRGRGAPIDGWLVSAVYYWSDREGLVTGATEACSAECGGGGGGGGGGGV